MKTNLKTFPKPIHPEAYPEWLFIKWKHAFVEELQLDLRIAVNSPRHLNLELIDKLQEILGY